MTTVSGLFWLTQLPKRFTQSNKLGIISHNYSLPSSSICKDDIPCIVSAINQIEKNKKEINQKEAAISLQLCLTLQNLDLNVIKPEGLKVLCKYPWEQLQQLILNKNYLGDKGLKHLSKARMPNLKVLNLFQNDISSEGCRHLSKTECPRLQKLNLGKNKIRYQGCRYLIKAQWKYLKYLFMLFNQILPSGQAILRSMNWDIVCNRVDRDQ